MPDATASLPPTSELFTKRQLVGQHPHLLTYDRVDRAARNRHTSGLAAGKGVFETTLAANGVSTLDEWIALGGYRRQIWGITSKYVTILDEAAGVQP